VRTVEGQEVSQQPALDDETFARLEAAGSDRRRSANKIVIVLSRAMRERLNVAVSRYSAHHAFAQSYSSETKKLTANAVKRATKVVAAGGELVKVLDLLQNRRADLLTLIYEEGTASAMFFEGAPIRSEDPKGDSLLKSFLADAKEFVARAERRRETLRRRGPGKPPHMHDYILIWEAAEVFEEAGGSIQKPILRLPASSLNSTTTCPRVCVLEPVTNS
jgi:hypothetical protein